MKWAKMKEEFNLEDKRISEAFSLPMKVCSEPYLRATCCKDHLYLCKIEKIDFLKICQEEGFY